jgi:non-specific serine/threonine protein kinase
MKDLEQPTTANPARERAPGHPDDEAAVVHPASASRSRPAHDDATVVKPSSQPTSDTPDGGNGDSSLNQASWRRVAEAQVGEDATVGMLLKERFLLERELGRGGMGVVYLARDERKVEARDRDPYVAVKVLNDEFRRHPDSLIALQREARRAQQLAHDNIVRVYDFDKDGTIVFMTMEYIEGTDLRTLIRERAYAGMPIEEAWTLIEGMARALERAHANGIVHSDFKPGNVMVTRDGVPKVFDFGIARAGKFAGEAAGDQTVFDAGTLGALTPAYASLEMIQGKSPTASDDVYALGCVIFELLTGGHPFDKLSAEVAMNEGARPPLVPGLSKRQYKALTDSVAFRGDERLQSADALIEGLRRQRLRERLAPYFMLIAAVALLAAGGWALHGYLRQRHVEEVISRFAYSDPRHYANEDEAVRALDGLGDEQRKRVVLDRSEIIQSFLLGRLDDYWNPDSGRFDYQAAQHVFQLRDKLQLFSTAFDARHKQIEDQRNDLINTLVTQLGQASDHAALSADQPDNAAKILARIRDIDPNSTLLRGSGLELKYDAAIGQSLAENKLDEARSQIDLGLRLFPDSSRLKLRKDQLLSAMAFAAGHPAAIKPVAMSVPDARRSLVELAARPVLSAEWQGAVADAMSVLQGDTAPETRQTIDALTDSIFAEAAQVINPSQAQQGLDLVNVGLKYAPQSAGLIEQRDRLQELLQQQKIDQQIIDANVASQSEPVQSVNEQRQLPERSDRMDAGPARRQGAPQSDVRLQPMRNGQ